MNSLTQKPYKTKQNHCDSTNTGRNDICHVDHDVTFCFKVKRESYANGDSWNEFPDLKSLRNNKNNHRGRTNTSRDNKGQVDHDLTSSFRVTLECMREGHPIGDSKNVFLDLNIVRNRSKIIAPIHSQRHIEKVRC